MQLLKSSLDRVLGPPKKFTWFFIIKAAVMMSVSLALGLYLPCKLTIAETNSQPYRLFWVSDLPPNSQFKKHDFVLTVRPNPWKEKYGEKPMVKEIGCVAGEMLTTQENVFSKTKEFFCNGKSLGVALAADSKGKPIEQWSFAGQIPEGDFYLTGHHPRSYDSRYYGLVTTDTFIAKLIPLI